MPKLMDKEGMDNYQTLHSFNFSAANIDKLGASEYTIVSIVQDASSSVSAFKDDMEETLGQILEACKKSPRSENLLLRLVQFESNLVELHGFRELGTINSDEYKNIIQIGGTTALRDAVLDTAEATETYGKKLVDYDYRCNAVIFIITDGADNASKIARTKDIRDAWQRIRTNETLESIMTVLIGVGSHPQLIDALKIFQTDSGIDQFVQMGEATPEKLARLADFISRSISSTSKALGSGQSSQILTF